MLLLNFIDNSVFLLLFYSSFNHNRCPLFCKNSYRDGGAFEIINYYYEAISCDIYGRTLPV